jgi:hypothetical protein
MRNKKGTKRKDIEGSDIEDNNASEMSDDEKGFSDSSSGEDMEPINKKVRRPDSPPPISRAVPNHKEENDLVAEMTELRLNRSSNQQDGNNNDNQSADANPPSSRSESSSLTSASASMLNSPRSNDDKSQE